MNATKTPEQWARELAETLHSAYSNEWWLTTAKQKAQFHVLYVGAETIRKRIASHILSHYAPLHAELESVHQCLLNREQSLKQAGEDWVKAKTELDAERAKTAKLHAELETANIAYEGLTQTLGVAEQVLEESESKVKTLHAELASAKAESERLRKALQDIQRLDTWNDSSSSKAFDISTTALTAGEGEK